MAREAMRCHNVVAVGLDPKNSPSVRTRITQSWTTGGRPVSGVNQTRTEDLSVHSPN